ncbi:unnamed protein product [Calypogeia fissa]
MPNAAIEETTVDSWEKVFAVNCEHISRDPGSCEETRPWWQDYNDQLRACSQSDAWITAIQAKLDSTARRRRFLTARVGTQRPTICASLYDCARLPLGPTAQS